MKFTGNVNFSLEYNAVPGEPLGCSANRTGIPCKPVRTIIGESDIDTADAVQEQITKRRIEEGARLVGRKIGLTAASAQAQWGASQPD